MKRSCGWRVRSNSLDKRAAAAHHQSRTPTLRKDTAMAKGQMKSSRETRKPKAEKPKKQNASNPSQKVGIVAGLDNTKKV